MKKLIGLIPLYDDDKDSYWMLPGYMKVLESCGALPVMLPLTTDPKELDDCFQLCDGIWPLDTMWTRHFTQRRQRKPAEYHAAAVIRWKRICLRKHYRKTSRYLESAEAYSL